VEEAGYALDVEWVDAWESVAPPPSADSQAECCVVCSGIKTCACRVQAPCGSCCEEQCRGCSLGTGLVARTVGTLREAVAFGDSGAPMNPVWR
jgi:hypothetical protein